MFAIMRRRFLFLVATCCCSWSAFGEWYHLNSESGHSAAPDVTMSMTDITVDTATNGTFYFTKEGTTEQGSITRTEATLLISDILSSDAPGYNGPGMTFDGKTHVDLGDHTNSCFDNFALCSNGWTMGLWLKAEDQFQAIIESGSAYIDQRGISLVSVGSGRIGFIMASDMQKCQLMRDIHCNEWVYLMLTADSTKCEIMETSADGRTLDTSDVTSGVTSRSFPSERRLVLGASSFFGSHGIFSLDEVTVWYQKLDVQKDGSVFLSQTSLASICTSGGDCSSVRNTHCSANAGRGTDKYCQCLGEVSYKDATYSGTMLTSLTPSCGKLLLCRRLTKADLIALTEKKRALGIP